MKKTRFLKDTGMGLIEVMAAVAIVGGLSLTLSQLIKTSQEGVKQTEAKSGMVDLKGILQNNFANTAACTATFGPHIDATNLTAATGTGLVPVTAIRNKVPTILYTLASTNLAPLTLTGMYITNYQSAAGTFDFLIQSTFKKSSTQTVVVKPIRIGINANINGSSTLVSCSTMAIGGEWMLTGNAGTVPGTDYLGTSDNNGMVIKTNAIERARFTSAGNFGLGTTTALSKLSATNGTYTSGSGNSDGYAPATIMGYTELTNGIGVYGRAKPIGDSTKQYGVRGDCTGPNVSAYCTGVFGYGNYTTAGVGRSYGVSGWNNANGSEGWNYAVHGWLYGTRSGAAVFGSSDAGAGDVDVSEGITGNRWAGYFNGSVKVTTNLTSADPADTNPTYPQKAAFRVEMTPYDDAANARQSAITIAPIANNFYGDATTSIWAETSSTYGGRNLKSLFYTNPLSNWSAQSYVGGGVGSSTLGNANITNEHVYGLSGGVAASAAAVTGMTNSHMHGVSANLSGIFNVDPVIETVPATATVGAHTIPGTAALYAADRTLGSSGGGIGNTYAGYFSGKVRITGGIEQDDWANLPIGNANLAVSWGQPAYFKDTMGIIHLRGCVKNNTGGTNPTIGPLPSGFRPLTDDYRGSAVKAIGMSINSAGTVWVQIFPSGYISLSSVANGDVICFDNVSFRPY